MKKPLRHKYIINELEKKGRVLTTELAPVLNVTEDTIRKDLQEMSKDGIIKRFHGGALKNEDIKIDFQERITLYKEGKELLAKSIIKELSNFNMIFLDSGTTNLAIAKNLINNYNGTIITNSPPISIELSIDPNIKIILIGGELDNRTRVIRNAQAIEQINKLNIECTVLGISELSIEKGITYPNQDEAFLKTALINNSDVVLGAVIKEKLNKYSTFYAGKASSIDILITDENSEEILLPYKEIIDTIISVDK